MSGAFEARYEGWCPMCRQPIEAGDLICYPDDEDRVVHVTCSPPTPAKALTICQKCHLAKPCYCEEP